MILHGENILGAEKSKQSKRVFRAVNPATQREMEPGFHDATEREVAWALELAAGAFREYREKSPQQIAGFLELIGSQLEDLGANLISRAMMETALPEERLLRERARCVQQLRMFAQAVRDGGWQDARIDRAMPSRKPFPKPDVRRILMPMGPVVLFSACNFPLAFSAAGGDAASALAAGNTVVVKAHPAHPGTSELVARAVQAAVEKAQMPRGVFSMIHGASPAVGLALVRHPLAKAVAFTGSLKTGRVLFKAASSRREPIPFYGEMGSINPVFVLPDALRTRGNEIADGLVQSLTLNVGQFCTNPGIVIGLEDATFSEFIRRTAALAAQIPAGTMLHSGICENYWDGVSHALKVNGVKAVESRDAKQYVKANQAVPIILSTDSNTFIDQPRLHEEIFGPATIMIGCKTGANLDQVARHLLGQLTITVHATEKDRQEFRSLLSLLADKAGRLIYNGFPTGVEICTSMQHGGPYPATTDVRSTSIGSAAMLRFVRPICYQDFPQELLPVELRDRNDRNIWRMIDGQMTKEPIEKTKS